MGMDRFIRWGEPPQEGPPTLERLMKVLQDFLGSGWQVRITSPTWIVAESEDMQTFPLASEFPKDDSYARALREHCAETSRGFEVCFMGEHGEEQTSVITRSADEFTKALADQFAKIIARWWNGVVEWPG